MSMLGSLGRQLATFATGDGLDAEQKVVANLLLDASSGTTG